MFNPDIDKVAVVPVVDTAQSAATDELSKTLISSNSQSDYLAAIEHVNSIASGNYAFSGECASKVNEKLSFNAAASFVPGQDYQGTDNSYSARAGFVFKLGMTCK